MKKTPDQIFKILYDEVANHDAYHLKGLNFTPDIVFDIGANIGAFSRYARELYPDARIIAVEPDEFNIANHKRFIQDGNTKLLEAAIGTKGVVYRCAGPPYADHEVYLTPGLGYSDDCLKSQPDIFTKKEVQSMTFEEIILTEYRPGMKTVVKIDCEGGENSIWQDEGSMAILKEMDYVSIELHYHASTGLTWSAVKEVTDNALESLKATHHCIKDHPYFSARKK